MTTMTRTLTPPPEDQHKHEEFTNFHKKSKRHGHGQDVTDVNNVRQVAGCLPLDLATRRVLLISSRKNKDAWVIPKGGWEKDETQKHAAQRETWEEAGIKGTITRELGVFEERTNKKKHLKAHHWIFEMNIEEVAKKFPEKKKRDRRWFTFEEAIIATSDHRYIQEAILQSSLNPSRSPPSPRDSIDEEPEQEQEEKEKDVVEQEQDVIKEKQEQIVEMAPSITATEKERRKSSFFQSIRSIFY